MPARAAVATTEADQSTLVVSNLSEVVAVLADIEAGPHQLSNLPPNAAVSNVRTSGDQLLIDTVRGVGDGHTLWEAWTGDPIVGKVEVGTTPTSEQAVEWVLIPADRGQRVGPSGQLSVTQGNLNPNGTLDLFLRVTQNGVPVSTGFSTDVPLNPSDSSKGGLPTGRAAISGWSDAPTLVELQYTNTTTDQERVWLAVAGWRGTRWIGEGLRPAIGSPFVTAPQASQDYEVEPRGAQIGEQYHSMIHAARVVEVASVVDALDPAFHHGFFARTTRMQNRGFTEVTTRHMVPAQGERVTLTVTSPDMPNTFEKVRWDSHTRQVHLDWTGVTCREAAYVLLLTTWSLEQRCPADTGLAGASEPPNCSEDPSETGRAIVWRMVSPVSDSVQFPTLPPKIDHEVLQATADPSFALTISVVAWAGEASYAHAAGLDGRTMAPADLGKYSCHVGYVDSIR